MALHPLAEHFAAVAAEYEHGRPEYAPAVVECIAAELQIAPGAPVLDLAAGTGKLTRALLGCGFDVTAVEPQAALRAALTANVGEARVSEGLAEEIPLPNSSVVAVTVADAFHWFDATRALREIRRVLRPRGGLAVVSSVPDWSEASWAHEVGTLLSGLRPAHPYFDGPPWQDAVRAAGGWSTPREINLTTYQPADAAQMVDYLVSLSWVAGLPEDRRNEILLEIRAIVDAGRTPSRVPVQVLVGVSTLA